MTRSARSRLVNAITFARVPLIFAWLGFAVAHEFAPEGARGLCLAVCACAMMLLSGLSDAVDGALARRWGVVSTLGKMADPLMDKVFYIVAFPALTWQVMGNRFVHVKRSDDSLFVEKVLDNWIRNVDVEARRTFVDTVFQVLSAGGGVTMKDVRKSGFSEMVEAVTKLPREQQKETIKVVRELLRSGEKALYQQIGLNDELPGFIRKWASKRGDEIEAKANRQEPQLTDKSQNAQKPEKETAGDREEVKESKDYSFEEEVRRLLREKTPEKATSEAKG